MEDFLNKVALEIFQGNSDNKLRGKTNTAQHKERIIAPSMKIMFKLSVDAGSVLIAHYSVIVPEHFVPSKGLFYDQINFCEAYGLRLIKLELS